MIPQLLMKVSSILNVSEKRLKFKPIRNMIVIDLLHNRHVHLTLTKLLELQNYFEATNITITSTRRCCIELTINYEEECECKAKHKCCRKLHQS